MRSESLDVLLLLRSRDSQDWDVVYQAAQLCDLSPVIVDHSCEALRALESNPTIAMFPLDADRVNGVRLERAMSAANPAVTLVGFGPAIRASIVCRLLAAGVTTYVDRPLNTEQVALQLETLRGSRNRLEHAVRAAVGTTGMKDVQRMVRFTMCAEALDRVRGSRRAAARLLGVDRRAIQKLIEQMQDSEMSGAGE